MRVASIVVKFATGFPNDVLLFDPYFRRVLDQQDSLVVGTKFSQAVQERRLAAGRGAAN
jgi:hypothetical protein